MSTDQLRDEIARAIADEFGFATTEAIIHTTTVVKLASVVLEYLRPHLVPRAIDAGTLRVSERLRGPFSWARLDAEKTS